MQAEIKRFKFYLFNTRGRKLSGNTNYGSWFRKMERKLVTDGFINLGLKLHNFRYTFATRFFEETEDIYTLQKMLGHQNLKTTEVYLKVKPRKIF